VNQTVIITGIREIDKRLKKLPGAVAKKVIRRSMRDGLKIVAAEIKSQVPVLTGLTKSAVQVRAVKSRKRNSISLETRIGSKKEGLIVHPKSGKPVFYPAVVEYGREGVAPNPFMRRAYDSKGEAAKQVTILRIKTGVDEEVRRL
jgi:HK97 gp10 family phage protein